MVNVSSRKRRHESTGTEGKIEREYQVETILDKRVQGRKTQYLLKWKDYSDADNTWEDGNRLNCPDLLKEFEEHFKEKNDSKKSTRKKSKNNNMQETDGDEPSNDDQSIMTENGTDSTKNDDEETDENRMITRQSPRKKVRLSPSTSSSSGTTRRHSSRIIVNETKSRITFMSKDHSSNENLTEEELSPTTRSRKNGFDSRKLRNTSIEISTATIDDDKNNNNNNIESSGKSLTKKNHTHRLTTTNPRLRITPSATSSVSYSFNPDEHVTENPDTESASDMVDETDQVERIETVKYGRDGISFRIKLINENTAQWIPSKTANRKYPQAVIAFWESHVEFT